MKRILGMVSALTAVLAFGSVSHAGLVTLDFSPSGGGGSVNSESSFCPGSPGCVSTGATFYVTPFDVGSNAVVDIEGSSVSLVSGTLNINATTITGGIGGIITNVVVQLGPTTGTLSGQTILWSAPSTLTTTGTWQCLAGICTLTGLTAGVNYPIASLSAVTGTVAVNPVDLGKWYLNAGLNQVLTSTRAIDATGGPSPPPGPGLPAQWYTFGVPEPSTIALVLLGLGGLALRSRKA